MKLKISPASTDLLGGSEHSPHPSDEKLKQQQQQFEPQWWERVAMFVVHPSLHPTRLQLQAAGCPLGGAVDP